MTTNSTSVKTAAGLVRASQKAATRKWSFLAVFVLVLFTTVSTAASLDLLPDPASTATTAEADTKRVVAPSVLVTPELPSKIEIPTIGLSQTVGNPETADVEELDHALLTGPVRYPSSSKLGQSGTVIILGHSSYLPIVRNQAFKAFDGIQNLKEGDRITVTGSGHEYVYAVTAVEKKSATEDSIPLYGDGSTLVLATCDSFGEKTDRFIVTAKLVETDVVEK